MKKLYLTTILIIVFATITNSNLSRHCDDEGYIRDQKEAVLHQKDTLQTLNGYSNFTLI
ncbi:hypothetical protein [Flavobacterium sp. RS13.1]|uniref:hypothetical protein n=1 Tax=Flavobacterium sp. RS13.1 TaxID=3400345 RepID=UPI003AB0ED12